MLFTSFGFIFAFLPATFVGFFLIGRKSPFLAAAWLVVASLIFYGYWDFRYVALLVASAVFNYGMGAAIARRSSAGGNSHPLLVLAITANLALLGYFKYADFFIRTIAAVGGPDFALMQVVLPLGISFFTFTQIAFLVDAHRGVAREYNFVHYLLFVTYFPHLIAGPILHHKQIMPQFEQRSTYRMNYDSIAMGIFFFALGMAKKLILADGFGAFATPVFDGARDGMPIPFGLAWVGALSYTLQLYFDFSGYSDMAIGISKLFGVKLPLNFNSPYKATSIIDFWRRWHMTLSNFLRDYLYIPLGGNRLGRARRYVNLLITMLLGGLWHGANWTFVAWGVVHGLALVINHAWHYLSHHLLGNRVQFGRVGPIIAWSITFVTVVWAWVLFRAESFSAALAMFSGMLGNSGISLPPQLSSLAPYLSAEIRYDGLIWSPSPLLASTGTVVMIKLALGLLICLAAPNSQQIVEWIKKRYPHSKLVGQGAGLIFGFILAFAILSTRQRSEFLYFQF